MNERKNKMRNIIANYIRAGYSGLYLLSHEESRVEAELKAVSGELEHPLYAWSVTEGIVDTVTGTARDCGDPLEVLIAFSELPENAVLLLRDYHLFFEDANPVLVRQLKDQLRAARTCGKTIAVLGCRLQLPPELEREFAVIDFALPGAEQLGVVIDGIATSAKLGSPEGDERETLIDSARGMTTTEAENAVALSVVETGGLSPLVVSREKANAVKKNGLLEIIEAKETLDDIGGLDSLKDWLLQRRKAFTRRAVEYGLPTPKGVLILGIPGCGKSLTAKATARAFGLPLLKLDAGRIFAGLVGQSEGNLRSVIQTAEAIAPAVLWIDELEKGFSGSRGSGVTDGGTSARVFGSFIQWMQEKTAPVFVVATANDVTQLPPEMLRKGRWDELWFVDLPTREEREAIWEIQIARYHREPSAFDVRMLAKSTEGLTGAEIEQVFIEALYRSFARDEEPVDLTIGEVLVDNVPLSRLMAEQITALRQWAKGRSRNATSQCSADRTLRKLAV